MLDVGCGTGVFAERLVARHPEQPVTGVDVSPGMLAEARRKLSDVPNVCFVEASATALPFPDAAFDVVVSASVLRYVPDREAALREMYRVLAAGGRMVVLDWDRSAWTMWLLDRYLRLADSAHRPPLTASEADDLLREIGLPGQVERVRSGWWSFFLLEAHRRSQSRHATSST